MLGKTPPPDEKKTSLSLPVQTDQAALSQPVVSWRSTRLVWTGLGLALTILMGVSGYALHPLASHFSAEPSRLVPEVAFNPLPVLGPRGGIRSASGHARHSGLVQAVAQELGTVTEQRTSPVTKKRIWSASFPELADKLDKLDLGNPPFAGIGQILESQSASSPALGWQSAGSEVDHSNVVRNTFVTKGLKAHQGVPLKRLQWHFGDEYFDDLTSAKKRTKEILHEFSDAEALPDAQFRLIYDIIQYHPNRIKKRIDEVVSISVRPAENFPDSVCFWILRADGSQEDIGMRKCFPVMEQIWNDYLLRHRRISPWGPGIV